MTIASSLTPESQALLDGLQQALASFRADPTSSDHQRALSDARRQLAEALAPLSKRDTQGEFARSAIQLIGDLHRQGAQDIPVGEETIAWAAEKAATGPAGLLAAMTLVSASQLQQAPLLDDVPDGLWGVYTAWLFASAASPFAQRAKHLGALARWIERNPGAQCVREAADAFLASETLNDRTLSTEELALRGRILSSLFLRNVTRYASTPLPREGRPLKIGFVVHTFAPTSEAQNLRPFFEHADPARAEIHLFAFEPADDSFAQLSASRGHALQTLPSSTQDQLQVLRGPHLDVLVFFRDRLTSSLNDLTRLALHRIAPLQVAYSPSGKTTGLPEIDVVLSPRSTATDSDNRTGERFGVLPLDAPAFMLQPAPESTEDFSRQALGIADDTPVLVAAINGPVPAETRRAWARILAETPGSLLIVQQTENPLDPQTSAAVTTAFSQTLAEFGIAADRFALSDFRSHPEMLAILRLGDLYLEPLTDTDPRWTAEALALGLPVIAAPLSAPLLKAANAPEWIARDATDFIRTAVHALTHADERHQAAQQIRETVENYTEFSDTLAATDACTALLEITYDELVTAGHARFHKNSAAFVISLLANADETLRSGQAALEAGDTYQAGLFAAELLKANPRDTAARLLYGRCLFNEGNTARAITYLLATVQTTPDNAGAWYTLAQALHLNLQTSEAISALETCLRLDEAHTDAWLLLAELAESAGAIDLARDALEALKQLSPEHPQVAALAERLVG